ncbi:MAG: PAS domain-containing sensor histidine kinase, partial [Chloroflexota bacterium]
YLIIGGLWIVFSDKIAQSLLGHNESILVTVQTFKGWLFVLITAAILYALLKRELDARQASEQMTIESERRFRDLFYKNPMPMWIANRDPVQTLEVNDAACTFYGYSRAEFFALKVEDLIAAEDIPLLVHNLRRQPDNFRFEGERHHRTQSGQIIDVELSADFIRYEGKRAVLVVVRDETERKRAEEERLENERLRAQLSKEAELHQMRDRFISMVSHEFRRPLTTITTSIDLLENYRSKMTEDVAQRHFTRIHEQLDESNELLDDFLALMRSEINQQGFSPTPVDLTEICAKLVDQIRLTSKSKHTVLYSSACQQVLLKGDEKLLRHAISNMLTNAVKYSPEGGEVRLDLRRTEAIEIHVSDQGIGIPEKDQVRLFEPFYRASNVGEMKGTGLGLSIARQAIEAHGGTLEIAKSDASGTEFIIKLPVNEGVFLTGC